MKKISVIFITIMLLFSLASCITVNSTANLQRSRDEIQAIKIYYLEEIYDEANVHNLREENTPIYTLSKEQQDEFLDTLCTFEYSKTVILAPIPFDGGCTLSGYVISIEYNDGKSYELMSKQGRFSYLVNKKNKEGYRYDYSDYSGELDWAEFIESYIEK